MTDLPREILIKPRFCDTDAQGHINNTVFPVWLLEGRQPIVEMYTSDLGSEAIGLALVRQEIDYLAECFFGTQVKVITQIEKLGNSSIHVQQQIWQGENLCVRARAILACFDRKAKRSVSLPDALRQKLQQLEQA